jgi:hypothetical protein
MGCPALGVYVAFLKHPDALPFLFFFVWGASPGNAGCLKNATQTLNAGHPI